MIRAKVYKVLSSSVGGIVNKIRPIVLKLGDELPSVTYQTEKKFDHIFDGESGFEKATIEINVYATSLKQAYTISKTIGTALSASTGAELDLTIFNVIKKREIEGFEPEDDEYRINTQFLINYTEK